MFWDWLKNGYKKYTLPKKPGFGSVIGCMSYELFVILLRRE